MRHRVSIESDEDQELEGSEIKKPQSPCSTVGLLILVFCLGVWLCLRIVSNEIGCQYAPFEDPAGIYREQMSENQALKVFESAISEVKYAVYDPTANRVGRNYVKPTDSVHYRFPNSRWATVPPTFAYQYLNTTASRENFLKQLQECHHHLHGIPRSTRLRLGWGLFNNPDDHMYREAEYYHLQREYNIESHPQELGMCVVSSGKNLFSRQVYKQYILSLARQNYTNFHVVVIDDGSTDFTTEGMYAFVEQAAPRLKSHIKFVRNLKSIGAFANKDSGIKEHCKSEDIVIDMDADDSLIGRQVFKLINAVYQSQPDIWVAYTSYMPYSNSTPHSTNIDNAIEVEAHEYRSRRLKWSTSHLKTYRMSLYEKIPFHYLTEKIVDGSGIIQYKYQKYASDQVMLISMVEMAGLSRVAYIPEPVYAYRRDEVVEGDVYCHRIHQLYDEHKIRMKVPLQTLKELDEQPRALSTYRWSYALMSRFSREKSHYEQECRNIHQN